MSIKFDNKEIKNLGSWQRLFIPSYSERIKRARERTIKPMEVCLERIQTEIKSYEQYKNEPRIVQQAYFLETYLKEKTITIFEDELIVGNITSKPRGAPVSMCNISILAEELDDPVKDFSIRPYDKMIIHPEERKLIRERIIPAAKGNAEKTIKSAEGYALDRINRAKGDAARFVAMYNEYSKAKDVTRRRLYLEALKNLIPKLGSKYIIDADQKNFLPLLNLGKQEEVQK